MNTEKQRFGWFSNVAGNDEMPRITDVTSIHPSVARRADDVAIDLTDRFDHNFHSPLLPSGVYQPQHRHFRNCYHHQQHQVYQHYMPSPRYLKQQPQGSTIKYDNSPSYAPAHTFKSPAHTFKSPAITPKRLHVHDDHLSELYGNPYQETIRDFNNNIRFIKDTRFDQNYLDFLWKYKAYLNSTTSPPPHWTPEAKYEEAFYEQHLQNTFQRVKLMHDLYTDCSVRSSCMYTDCSANSTTHMCNSGNITTTTDDENDDNNSIDIHNEVDTMMYQQQQPFDGFDEVQIPNFELDLHLSSLSESTTLPIDKSVNNQNPSTCARMKYMEKRKLPTGDRQQQPSWMRSKMTSWKKRTIDAEVNMETSNNNKKLKSSNTTSVRSSTLLSAHLSVPPPLIYDSSDSTEKCADQTEDENEDIADSSKLVIDFEEEGEGHVMNTSENNGRPKKLIKRLL